MVWFRTLPFVPSAVAFGHLLAYMVAHPEPAERVHALDGHGHLWLVLAVGAVSGLLGLGALAYARSTDRRLAPRYGRLAQLGALGFWLLEAAERVVHGRVEALATEPALWWGLVLQAVIAGLLVGLARSASYLGVRFASRRPVRPTGGKEPRRWCTGQQHVVCGAAWPSPNRLRGPPLLAC